jgi:hypothetical protein
MCPLTPPPLWWLILILTLALWWTASIGALAHAQAPPSEGELVRVPVRVLRQCEQDAARVDGLESRLVACQRDLDAGSGALTEARRSALESRVQIAQLKLQIERLERERDARWSPWAWMGVGATGALVAVVVAVIVAR